MRNFVVGACNMLGWHHSLPGGKDAAYPDGVWRANQWVKKWGSKDATIVGVNECERIQFRAVVGHWNWAGVMVEENNRNLVREGNWMANVVFYRPGRVKVIYAKNIHVTMADRPLGLNMPYVLFEAKKDFNGLKKGQRFAAIVFHLPRYGGVDDDRAVREARGEAITKINVKINYYANQGIPTVLLGDGNTEPDNLANQFTANRLGAHTDVMAILGRAVRFFARGVDRTVVGRLSDHGFIWNAINKSS